MIKLGSAVRLTASVMTKRPWLQRLEVVNQTSTRPAFRRDHEPVPAEVDITARRGEIERFLDRRAGSFRARVKA